MPMSKNLIQCRHFADQLCMESDQICSNGRNKLTSYFIMHVHGGNQTVASICRGTQMRPTLELDATTCMLSWDDFYTTPSPSCLTCMSLEPRVRPLGIIVIRAINVLCAHDRLSLFCLIIPMASHLGLWVCFSGELMMDMTKDQQVTRAGESTMNVIAT